MVIIALIAANLILTAVLFVLLFGVRAKFRATNETDLQPLISRTDAMCDLLVQRFSAATADMAERLADTKGELRQQLTDRLDAAFKLMIDSIDAKMSLGRSEQSRILDQTILRLEGKFTGLQQATETRLEGFADKQTASLAETQRGLSESQAQSGSALKQEVTTLGAQTREAIENFRRFVEQRLAAMADRQDQSLISARREMSESLGQNVTALKQEVAALTNQTREGLEGFRQLVDQKLQGLADRQAASLAESRREMGESLAKNGATLRQELSALTQQNAERLEAIRGVVDGKLAEISGQVSVKLEANIKEGFKQFEKVQEHLKAAEEQLRNVNTIGASINDLNNLLKLPHLRGRFGEASLERLLEDFLPAHMYELQAVAGENGQGRADAIIKFPERNLPIDAKFPREQVLPLFESSDPAQLAAAREQFARVIKEQARRIAGYIHPENGTTDMALMYLPSETLYMEAVLNGELSGWLNSQKIFPVSPNTLIVTLQSIQMVFKMYEFAKNFENATQELAKAQKSFGYFEQKFDDIGKSLDKAQNAYGTARRHLGTYRRRVTDLTGEQVPEIDGPTSVEDG